MAQQTAVEWFAKQVEENLGWYPVDIIKQAKQMEKEQIKYAWQDGFETGDLSEDDGTEYYTQTYNQTK